MRKIARLTCALLAGGLLPVALAAGPAAATANAPAGRHGGILSVVAGGRGGPGPAANVSVVPCGMEFARGHLYVASLAVVYRVSQATGQLVPVAGSGPWGTSAGSTGDGVPAADAQLAACGVATDAAGNMLLAGGTSVRVVAARTGTYYGQKMSAGRVYTLATGFNNAVDVRLDSFANLVVADGGTGATETNPEVDAQIWVIAKRTGTFYGHQMTAGHMYVVAGNPFGYVLGNGVLATSADLGVNIGTVRLDRAGNLVIADPGGGGTSGNSGTHVPPGVRVVAARSGTYYGQPMKAGYIYTIAGGIAGHVGNGVPALRSALAAAAGIALDHHGNVIVADGGRARVIAVRSGTFYQQKMKAGYLYAIAGTSDGWGSVRYSGDGGPATGAAFEATEVDVDSAGNVLLDVVERVLTVAERTGAYYGRTMAAGHIYSVAGNGRSRYSGDGGPAASAELSPSGVTWDRPAGLMAAVDSLAGVIRVAPDRSGTYFGQRMTAGYIYTIAGNGRTGYSGDGGLARDASLDPAAVDADRAGNLLVADYGAGRIRVLAVRSGTFYGQRMTAGYIYTIAGNGSRGYSGDGGSALAAGLPAPRAVTADRAGNVLVTSGTRVRMVVVKAGTYFGRPMTAGNIYTVAGDGFSGYTGIGGPATAAGIAPQATAVDRAGNMLIADGDYGHNAVLVVPDRSGMFYGQKMTAGTIYAIAGPGTATPVSGIASVAVDPAGNVALSEYNDVKVLAERTGTYYGQRMTRGRVYLVAGLGRQLSGPAISAAVGFGDRLAVGAHGKLLLSDSQSGRIVSISR